MSVVCDQIGTPDLGRRHRRGHLGSHRGGRAGGIYHWTDLGVASWYDFAVAIQEEALARGLLSRAVADHSRSRAAPIRPGRRRPAFSVLDTDSTRALVTGSGAALAAQFEDHAG